MDQPSAINPQIEERQNPSFFSKYKFTLISLCVIIVALVPLLILSQHTSPNTTSSATQNGTASNTNPATPTTVPLTRQNAVPTLDAVNNQIQTALDQSNTDIQQASQIDTSQDSTNGL